jgi:hypothetical protein
MQINETYALADYTIAVLRDSRGEIAAVLVHEQVPKDVQFWKLQSVVTPFGKVAGRPLTSVLGAAYIMPQTPSTTEASGCAVLFTDQRTQWSEKKSTNFWSSIPKRAMRSSQ